MLPVAVAEAFVTCERDGWAWCPAAIAAPDALVAELADVVLIPLEPQVGKVEQRGASGVAAIEGRPRLAALADELAASSGGWRPDEVALGRYGRGDGISAHRDNSFYTGFVVVLTVAGSARFQVLADRTAEVVLGEFVAEPGDLALLRGARPSGEGGAAARPFHAVGPPENGEERTVLVLRRNARGAGRGWA